MIGGYLYRKIDEGINARLQQLLESCTQIALWDIGIFFHNLHDGIVPTYFAASNDTAVLCPDLIIGEGGDSGYRQLDLKTDFLESYCRNGATAFDGIHCDFRMAVAAAKNGENTLRLVSHRAGACRMYYHKLETGILFCSDLRFLLRVIPLDVDSEGVYSILKYGFIPEPSTISRNVSAVPASHYLEYNLKSGQETVHPFFQFRFDCSIPANDACLDGARSALQKSAALLSSYPTAMLLSGGIDSSLFGCFMKGSRREMMQFFYCAFGKSDPEYPYAAAMAKKLEVDLNVVTMEKPDALQTLDDVVQFSDHPFSDFSSLPIVFLLKHIRNQMQPEGVIVECNGGDDCFGFAALQYKSKYTAKHAFPKMLKKGIAASLRNLPHWKWESHEGTLARIAALADVHENTLYNYFLVQAPVHYIRFNAPQEWDETLQERIERISQSCSKDYAKLGFKEKITIRQLLFTNSHRWTAKALSVSESLGLRVLYPYIWRDILREQGKIPWDAKVHKGIVKWPLKRMLEDFMPGDFIHRKKSGFVPPLVHWLTDPAFNRKVRDIVDCSNGFVSQVFPFRVLDQLLVDALNGKRLRTPLLNTLWGAIFTESWIQQYRSSAARS